jgi:adenylate cyclase
LQKVVNEFQRQYGDLLIDLRQAQGQDFVEAYLDAEPNRLDDDFRSALYEHTQGHALFTAEMVHGLRERGDLVQDGQGRCVDGISLNWEILPARVEGVIGERIGRLPQNLLETLKIASVEGESFTAEIIARLQDIAEREMVRQLSGILDRQYRLVRAQGSRRLGQQRISQYRFRHILFQRYLYDGMDVVELEYLHEAIATELEKLHGQQTDKVAVKLAWHFEQVGLAVKASKYLYQAGSRAVRLPANEEAIAHF